jgi:hypothetical protein
MVVVAEFHGYDFPALFPGIAIEQLRYDRVMSIGEDVRLDHHLVADGALDRIAPSVDLRPDRLDDGARRRRRYFFARLIQA